MFYVYILKSAKQDGAIYIGYTNDLKLRIKEHNIGKGNHHTSKYRPWIIENYIAFKDKSDAEKFERYLKSNSGKAFLRKRLISNHFRETLKKFNNGRNNQDKRSEA